MLYPTCTTTTRVDLVHYVVSRAKDWVSVDCGATSDVFCNHSILFKSFTSVFYK